MKITITRPEVKPLNVTGAALRSVQAADAAADAAYNHLANMAMVCETIMLRENPTASDIADAIEALARVQEARKVVESLAPRHNKVQVIYSSTWPIAGGIYTSAENAIETAARKLRFDLIAAGVSMPIPLHGVTDAAQYWRDAAARGC